MGFGMLALPSPFVDHINTFDDSSFISRSSAQNWTLCITDHNASQTGTLKFWQIKIITTDNGQICGDGELDPDENCDDGFDDGIRGCVSGCQGGALPNFICTRSN